MEDVFDKAISDLKKGLRSNEVNVEPIEIEVSENVRRAYVERATAMINAAISRLRSFKELVYAQRRISGRSEKFVLVKFLSDVSGFLGPDGRTIYGPYKRGDVAYIPRECADVLERAGKIKRIRISRRSKSLGTKEFSNTSLASFNISSSSQRRDM